jgi:hypothetical protein
MEVEAVRRLVWAPDRHFRSNQRQNKTHIVSALRADAAKKTIPATKTSTMREENSRKFLNRYHGKRGSFGTMKS